MLGFGIYSQDGGHVLAGKEGEGVVSVRAESCAAAGEVVVAMGVERVEFVSYYSIKNPLTQKPANTQQLLKNIEIRVWFFSLL